MGYSYNSNATVFIATIALVFAVIGCVDISLARAQSDASQSDRSKSDMRPIAILDIEVSGVADKSVITASERAVKTAVADVGMTFLPRSQVQNTISQDNVECRTSVCLEQIASSLATDRLLAVKVDTGRVTHTSDYRYTYTVQWLSPVGAEPNTQGVRYQKSSECAVCTPQEFEDRLAQLTREVVTKMASLVAVEITTAPASGRVFVDGRDFGASPCIVEVDPGKRKITVKGDGYIGTSQEIDVAPNSGGQKVEILMVREHTSTGRGMAYVTGGLAVASVATGVAFLIVDGQGADCEFANSTCRKTYDSSGLGYALIGAGAALGGVSTWLFIKNRGPSETQVKSTKGAQLVPTKGGIFASFQGSF